MRVTILSWDHPPNDGGISRLSAGIAAALAAAGARPEVLTLAAGAAAGPARPGVPHREVPRPRGRREAATLLALLRLPRARPVLATVWNPEASLAVLAGRRRLSVLAHGNEVMAAVSPARARLRRLVLERARAVVCNSAFTAGLVRAAAPAARAEVLHPGLDPAAMRYAGSRAEARAAFGLPPEGAVALSVARLDPVKGHDTVLAALARLPGPVRARLTYAVAGRGPLEAALRARAAALGVGEAVRFLGYVPDGRLPALYAAADLFVLCSALDPARGAVEGFGIAFSEAQAAGRPVVATRSGGIPEAVRDGEGGWLVAEGDAAAVAGHLAAVVADPAPYARMGEAGRARVVREQGWDAYAARLLGLL